MMLHFNSTHRSGPSSFQTLLFATVRELFRTPTFLILLTAAAVVNLLTPSWTLFVFHEQQRIILDSTLNTTILFGMIAAFFAAVRIAGRGNERYGELLFVKPVSPVVILAARLSGIVIALSGFLLVPNACVYPALYAVQRTYRIDITVLIGGIAVILLAFTFGMLLNRFKQMPLVSTCAVNLMILCPLYTWILGLSLPSIPELHETLPSFYTLISVQILGWVSVLLMGTTATALITMCSTIPGIVGSLAVLSGGLLLHPLIPDHTTARFITGMFFPDWQCFWLTDTLAFGGRIPLSHLCVTLGYAAVQAAGWGLLALFVFKRKEMSSCEV